ncbi:MAG: GtrA family protein [Coriobacteriia bacterium]|nr:GtrA family protein [Coriobacteriia bacterium]
MKNQLIEIYEENQEIILYLIFGVATTVINWSSYAVLVKYARMSIFWGNAISWVAATLFAFITNKLWVFMSKSLQPSVLLKEFIFFVSTRLGTGAFEVIAVPGLVRLGLDQAFFNVRGFAAKILVSIVVVVLNYVLSKLIIFKNSPEETAP